jgi:hypothetical protein
MDIIAIALIAIILFTLNKLNIKQLEQQYKKEKDLNMATLEAVAKELECPLEDVQKIVNSYFKHYVKGNTKEEKK